MEQLKHECGVAMIRLLKPFDYYVQKYGTAQYALNKMYLLGEATQPRSGGCWLGLCETQC